MILVARNDQAHSVSGQAICRPLGRKGVFRHGRRLPGRDRDLIDRPIGVHPHVREKMAIRRDDPRAGRPRRFTKSSSGSTVSRRCGVCRRPAGRTRSASTWANRLPGALRSPVRRPGAGSRAGEIRRDPADETGVAGRQALHARRLRFLHPATGEAPQSGRRCRPDIVGRAGGVAAVAGVTSRRRAGPIKSRCPNARTGQKLRRRNPAAAPCCRARRE